MGAIITCKKCGEKIEFVFNQNHKKIPLNVNPSVQYDKATGRYVHVRVSHFVTCKQKSFNQTRNNG